MKLFEYEAKTIFQRYDITVPRGTVVRSAAEAVTAARDTGLPVVLKSQVLAAGRGKAGGIQFAADLEAVARTAENLLGSRIKGLPVASLLLEEKLDLAAELYAAVTIDRAAGSFAVLAASRGGVEVEQVILDGAENFTRHAVHPLDGFSAADAAEMLARFNLPPQAAENFATALLTIYQVARDLDAELVEMNPLGITAAGDFAAVDARIIIDDNALFRHPEFDDRDDGDAAATPAETAARRDGFAYVDLPGDIGVVGNGAGLVMATLDVIDYYGGRAANFLDIGGGAQLDVIKRAVLLVIAKPAVRVVLVNILGGITRCDMVARGIVQALEAAPQVKPVVVRMVGTNETEGIRILLEAGIEVTDDMDAAVKNVTARGGQ